MTGAERPLAARPGDGGQGYYVGLPVTVTRGGRSRNGVIREIYPLAYGVKLYGSRTITTARPEELTPRGGGRRG